MLAASQVQLLSMTSRKHDIEVAEEHLSNEKVALARDSEKIFDDYNNALKQKCLKFSHNAGSDYINLSYSGLMRPGMMNLNQPYLLTDLDGRVVVDSNYLDYAKMISPNGSGGADWESNRSEILSKITGIDKSTIENIDEYYAKRVESEEQYYKLLGSEPSKKKFTETDIAKLLSKMSSDNKVNGDSWKNAYTKQATVSLGTDSKNLSTAHTYVSTLKSSLGKYFLDNKEQFEKACDTIDATIDTFETQMDEDKIKDGGQGIITGNKSDGFKLHIDKLVDQIMGVYQCNIQGSNFEWYDVDKSEYTTWKTEHDKWQNDLEAAENAYDSAIDNDSKLLTSEQENRILFYDKVFSTIAENGWTYNNQVEDDNYLNQVLQNGYYTITQVQRSESMDKNYNITRSNSYITNVASNFDNIIAVSDTEMREIALIKYQHEKSIIDKKETKIDNKLKDLDTELSAINQMIQAIESTEKDAIDRTFSIFS